MKNLMKGLSLMLMFLAFQGVVSAAEVEAIVPEAAPAIAAETEKTAEEKATELKALVADETAVVVPAIPAVEAK